MNNKNHPIHKCHKKIPNKKPIKQETATITERIKEMNTDQLYTFLDQDAY